MMERLTKEDWVNHDRIILDSATAAKVCKRLAEYEDLQKTPEELKSIINQIQESEAEANGKEE